MKKKTILTILLGIMALTANAQFLFRISGGGQEKPSYMLGTIHTLHGAVLDYTPEYTEAEAQCQQFYTEFDISDQGNMDELNRTGQQLMLLPEGKTIFDVLSKEQGEALDSRMFEVVHVHLTDSAMKPLLNFQPMLFTVMLTTYMTQEALKYGPKSNSQSAPIDVTCILRAKLRGMEMGQLDEVLYQDSIAKVQEQLMKNMDAQVDSLMSIVNNYDQRLKATIDEMEVLKQSVTYWCLKNYKSFANMDFWKKSLASNPALFQKRNEKWLPRMKDAMQKAPTMFVFGAGHLIGEHGVIQLLRGAGYTVEQVKGK